MEKEVIECMEKAEQNNDTCMSCFIKSNGLKRNSEKKEVELFEKEIVDLEAKKKELCLKMFDIVMLCYVCLNSDEKKVYDCVLDT